MNKEIIKDISVELDIKNEQVESVAEALNLAKKSSCFTPFS